MKEHLLYKQLDYALWATSSCRFLSFRKYKSIYISLQILIICLSFLLICIGILNITEYKISNMIPKENLDISVLIISIFIFSLSIYLPSLSNKVNLLHDNATDIASLLRMLKLAKNEENLKDISISYDRYLKQINHDNIDFYRWINFEKDSKYKHGVFKSLLYLILWHFYSKIVYILCFIIIFLIIIR